MMLFVWLSIITVAASFVLSKIGFSGVNPATGEVVSVYNLLSAEGLVRMITTAVTVIINFITRFEKRKFLLNISKFTSTDHNIKRRKKRKKTLLDHTDFISGLLLYDNESDRAGKNAECKNTGNY